MGYCHPVTRAGSSTGRQMGTKPLHILIVDHDEALLFAMRNVLEEDGHRVTTSGNGAQALEWLYANEMPDVLVLGMRLPAMTGWTFWSRLRFLRGADRLPVIAMSDDSTIRDRILGAGASAFLAKPFSVEQLLEAIDRAMRRPMSTPPPSAGRPDL